MPGERKGCLVDEQNELYISYGVSSAYDKLESTR